ncbi:MAG: B12-binding domain-containing protein [Planctomycetes bacterium]|jgi:excisionase family DNA binding protein|nr:B12-binding domain-containing protein [Planctomycetota bacterium]
MATAFLSPKDLAAAIGVSESSLKRWVDSGRLAVQRTAGGHRRIPLQEAVRFVRAEGYRVQDPSCFGVLCGGNKDDAVDLDQAVYSALLAGDAERCCALITTAYLAGSSIPSLCDGALRSAMGRLGDLWRHGEDGIAVEHHATSICIQVVEQLRQFLSDVRSEAPVAIGGGTSDDPYLVPSQMAGVVLSDCGYRAVNLGPHTPNNVLLTAVARYRPVLVWRSLTGITDFDEVGTDLRALAGKLGDIPLVVGGRHAASAALSAGVGVHVVGSMCELAAFARALVLRRPRTS